MVKWSVNADGTLIKQTHYSAGYSPYINGTRTESITTIEETYDSDGNRERREVYRSDVDEAATALEDIRKTTAIDYLMRGMTGARRLEPAGRQLPLQEFALEP